MKRINFALISDVIFFTLCTFFISLAAIRYFFKSFIFALIIALILSALCAVISFVLLFSNRRKRLALTLGENMKKSLSLHLCVCSQTAVINMFLNALDGTYAGDNCIEDENYCYYFNFKLSKISPDDIAEIIKRDSAKKRKLFCCDVSPEAASLAEDFLIEIATIGEVYILLKDKGLLPEKYALGEIKKPNVIRRIKKRFTRRICPSLFFSGFTLLFFSFFTFYPVYYIISGSLLMILSAISLFIAQSS